MYLLVLLGLACQEAGAAVAVCRIPDVVPSGVAGLRLAFSALVLVPVAWRTVRRGARLSWRAGLHFGGALAVMNVFF